METMWIRVNDAGRVKDTAIGGKIEDGVKVETPDGYDLERQQDWRLEDEALVYDPETAEPAG